MTREDWLLKLVGRLSQLFDEKGYQLPSMKISCGFTSKGYSPRAKVERRGECWQTKNGEVEIFISPFVDDMIEVGAICIHEMCHAVVGLRNKHNNVFKKAAMEIGLLPPYTSSIPSDELKEKLHTIFGSMSPYPHQSLPRVCSMTEDKQPTRLIKVVCPSCGYICRITNKWLQIGAPTCPCGEQMTILTKVRLP